MRIAILGYHYAGKTSLFSVLGGQPNPASGKSATLNLLNLKVPDSRLERIAKEFGSKKVTAAEVTFLDIEHVVADEKALSDEFLGHARVCDAILILVRGFADDNVYNPRGKIGPSRDALDLAEEMLLSDIEVAEKRVDRLSKDILRGKKESIPERDLLKKVAGILEEGKPLRDAKFHHGEEKTLSTYAFMTFKPAIGVVNVNFRSDDALISSAHDTFRKMGLPSLAAPIGLETELMEIDEHDEKLVFLCEYGYDELCADAIVKAAYDAMDAITFYVGNENETRALQLKRGSNARDAAGKVHTDIQKGFVRAEVFTFDDLESHGSIAAIRDAGKCNLEKKEYIVNDGDVIYFRFS